jgi:hypothetical protein
MISMMESASTIIPVDTLTIRVVGGDDMTHYSEATMVQTCHMTLSVIRQSPGQRADGGGRLGHQGRGYTSIGKHGHVVTDIV